MSKFYANIGNGKRMIIGMEDGLLESNKGDEV
jgi:hypothetical protein